MKFIILILAVLALVWLVRGARGRIPPPANPPASESGKAPQPMVACRQCGMHLPRDEALPGRGGVFCGEAHRAAYEKQHPAG
jgi:uncharacterized protein